MAKFTFYISTGVTGSEREEVIEIPDEELEDMDEKEVNEYVRGYYQDWLANNCDMGFYRSE